MVQAVGQKSLAGSIAAVWAVVGFSLILLDAIIRLAGIAAQSFDETLSFMHWAVLLLVVVTMAYAEGYRGFQKSFSPRTAARAYYVYRHPEPLAVLLAPLFAMGFFRATRGPLMFAWIGTALIVLLIIALQATPQPWRGIIDVGVVVGLSWGLVSFLVCVFRVFRDGANGVSAEVPSGRAP